MRATTSGSGERVLLAGVALAFNMTWVNGIVTSIEQQNSVWSEQDKLQLVKLAMAVSLVAYNPVNLRYVEHPQIAEAVRVRGEELYVCEDSKIPELIKIFCERERTMKPLTWCCIAPELFGSNLEDVLVKNVEKLLAATSLDEAFAQMVKLEKRFDFLKPASKQPCSCKTVLSVGPQQKFPKLVPLKHGVEAEHLLPGCQVVRFKSDYYEVPVLPYTRKTALEWIAAYLNLTFRFKVPHVLARHWCPNHPFVAASMDLPDAALDKPYAPPLADIIQEMSKLPAEESVALREQAEDLGCLVPNAGAKATYYQNIFPVMYYWLKVSATSSAQQSFYSKFMSFIGCYKCT